MGEHVYRCKSAKAVASRIWKADFYLDSFNEIVDSSDADAIVATVGLSDVTAVDAIIKMVVTLNDHPWSQEIAGLLFDEFLASDTSLLEWSISFKSCTWTIGVAWRQS